jgi:hypothetical protein
MIKLAVALLVTLVGLTVAEEFKWDSVPPAGNSSQCVYRSEHKILGCRSSVGVVECGVVGQLPVGFEVFGLSRVDGVVPLESQSFWLYPRELNKTIYMNHIGEVHNVTRNITLWHTESSEFLGLRVPEVKCWTRLVDLFNSSVGTRLVTVGELNTEVEIFGEVLVMDRQTKKRWLGLGLGLGWPLGLGLGWGWGLGWGLPAWALLG